MESLFYHEGKRVNYAGLSDQEKETVKKEKAKLAKELYSKLKNEKTPQIIDNGQHIEITYTSVGLDHFVNDVLLVLSGKYFSRKSMMYVHKMLERSSYIPTSHKLRHPRTDGRNLWYMYAYPSSDGKVVYFKVTYNMMLKRYELYSVGDRR